MTPRREARRGGGVTDELGGLDATAQAELVRRGDLHPRELVASAVTRIERVNPVLNAVISPLFDQALRAVEAPDLPPGPFRGVPLLVKDLGSACQAGVPQYMGTRLLRELDWRCPADSVLGAHFRAAGFVVVGVTNVPELGLQATTQPLAFGATRNPWDVTRSPSGSSGGAAAAVAAGVVPVAHANDGGGSIRHPASWCGLVGLKPSRGRTPGGPSISRSLCEHVLARTVRDSAKVLDAIHGSAPGDLFLAPAPSRPFVEEVGADAGSLRIGVMTSVPGSGTQVDPQCAAAVDDAARLLESLGHVVDVAGPKDLCSEEFIRRRRVLVASQTRAMLAQLEEVAGRPLAAADVEPYTWAVASAGRSVRADEYVVAEQWMQAYAGRVAAWWTEGWDVLLTPTTAQPPVSLAELAPLPNDPLAIQPRLWDTGACFSVPFNVTGQPAISLPLAWTSDGLPLGVQLVADSGREDVLIRLAAQLEVARPWRDRWPAVSA